MTNLENGICARGCRQSRFDQSESKLGAGKMRILGAVGTRAVLLNGRFIWDEGLLCAGKIRRERAKNVSNYFLITWLSRGCVCYRYLGRLAGN